MMREKAEVGENFLGNWETAAAAAAGIDSFLTLQNLPNQKPPPILETSLLNPYTVNFILMAKNFLIQLKLRVRWMTTRGESMVHSNNFLISKPVRFPGHPRDKM